MLKFHHDHEIGYVRLTTRLEKLYTESTLNFGVNFITLLLRAPLPFTTAR